MRARKKMSKVAFLIIFKSKNIVDNFGKLSLSSIELKIVF